MELIATFPLRGDCDTTPSLFARWTPVLTLDDTVESQFRVGRMKPEQEKKDLVAFLLVL